MRKEMCKNLKFLVILTCVALAACSPEEDINGAALDMLLEETMEVAGGKNSFVLPASDNFTQIPQDPQNALTSAKVELGKLLFHETAIGMNPRIHAGMQTFSCASCHHAAAGFQAGIRQGIGEGGVGFGVNGEGRRNAANYPLDSLDVQPLRTPSAMNTAYQQVMLWNGQFGAKGMNEGTEANWTAGTPIATNHLGFEGVETQAIAGLGVHRMEVIENYIDSLGYGDRFQEAFPGMSASERYTLKATGLAIAAYERTILANEAPFQKWLAGDQNAMTDTEKKGAILFFGKAACVSCHRGPALNSMAFYALGMDDLNGPGVYGTEGDGANNANKGRGGFTGLEEDMYKFKVPQLYNLTDSRFYGHGGSFESVKEVIEYKNNAMASNPKVPQVQLAEDFVPLGLNSQEIDELVTFIESALRDPYLSRYQPQSLPSNNCFPNADLQSKIDLGCN